MKNGIINHLAVIMDGNHRWAKANGITKIEGHHQGAIAARKIVENCVKHKIPHLSLYAFSSENWARPQIEIDNIMSILESYIDSELESLKANNVKLNVIGNLKKIHPRIQGKILNATNVTSANKGLNLYIALSYSGREELIEACKKAILSEVKPDNLSEEYLHSLMYAPNMPNIDIVIRTGGDLRISNFLPWHLSYAEFFSVAKYWPDFNEADLIAITEEFKSRERNFGHARKEHKEIA